MTIQHMKYITVSKSLNNNPLYIKQLMASPRSSTDGVGCKIKILGQLFYTKKIF